MGHVGDELVAFGHHGHVGIDDRVSETAELLAVLVVDDLPEPGIRYVVVLEKTRHLEEPSEERIPLHPQVKVLTIRRLARDAEPGQRVDPDLAVDDLLPVARRDPLPDRLRILLGLPHESPAVVEPGQRVGVGERFRVATEDDVDIVEIAVDPHSLRRDDEEVGSRRTLLLGSVPRVGADVQYLFGPTELVDLVMLLDEIVSDGADDLTEVLPRRDHAPSADGVQPHRDRVLGEQRGMAIRLHRIGMVDAENEVALPVGQRSSVTAGTRTNRVLVCPDDRLGTEVA